MADGAETRGAARAGGRLRASPAALVLCAIVLGLIVWGTHAQTRYAVLDSEDAELVRCARAAIERVVPTDDAELEYLVRRYGRPGGTLVEVGGEPIRPKPEVSGTLFWVTLLNALAFWAVCVFALALRLDASGVKDVFATLLMASIGNALGGVSYPHEGWMTPLPYVYVTAMALTPAFFVRFALRFPRPLPGLASRPALPALILLVSASVAAWNIVAWILCFRADGVDGLGATRAPTIAWYSLWGAAFVLGLPALWWNGRRAVTARAKRQVKWILLSIAIGAAPYVFRIVLRLVDREPKWIPPGFDRIVEMAIPAGFAVAVVKERLLDIDVIIRRSLLYTLLAAGGTLLFLVPAALLDGILHRAVGIYPVATWATAGLLAGLCFQPARRALGRLIDRTFFRIRFEHDQALQDLQRTLTAATGQAELAARLAQFLDVVLEPETRGVIAASGDERVSAGTVDAAILEAAPDLVRRLAVGRAIARPGATTEPEIETPTYPSRLADAGIDLVQPVMREGRMQALMLLGVRSTGRRWVQEDLDLLKAAAGEVATALERLELVQRAATEAMERRALAALSKQKADFFARLAHDLRTPVTAVRWSTRNLLDGLSGPLNEKQARYLEGVGAAAGQLERLVTNLVDLGRLDLSAPERPPEPVDLHVVAREAATALTAVATEREASIEIDVPEALPAIRGRRESAFQVVINLVENALKHAPEGTPVEIGLAADGDEVVLTVRDHGPGLPEEGRDALFDLFHQAGPESERKKGYGIGLYIVRAWMEAMDGTVEADDHPDGGARFTCRFVPWPEEEATA